MSIFSGIFTNIESANNTLDFSCEDVRFHLTDAQLEMDYEISAMENYFAAYDRLSAVCASIESFDGKLDDAVKDFVDNNGELSMALGIALENDQTSNGQAVKDKAEKGFFAKVWEAIKNFFHAIWEKIAGFFKWIFNGFRTLPKKIEMAEKKFNEMTPEEKERFLASYKTDLTPQIVEERFKSLSFVLKCLARNAEGNIYRVMERYYMDPSEIYPDWAAKALRTYNVEIVNEAGRPAEDMLSKKDPSFVNTVFRIKKIDAKKKVEPKLLKDNGWNEKTVQNLFSSSKIAADSASELEKLVTKLENEARSMNSAQMEEQYKKLIADTSSLFFRFFNMGVHPRIEKAGPEAYRKGLDSICNIYRACLIAIKDVWVDNNKILDLFKKSDKDRAEENK